MIPGGFTHVTELHVIRAGLYLSLSLTARECLSCFTFRNEAIMDAENILEKMEKKMRASADRIKDWQDTTTRANIDHRIPRGFRQRHGGILGSARSPLLRGFPRDLDQPVHTHSASASQERKVRAQDRVARVCRASVAHHL